MGSKTSLTTFQLIFLLIHAQVGVGLLSMPHDVFKQSETDSSIVILLTGIIIQLFIFIYAALMKRFPTHNLFEIARVLLGKKLGNAFNILFSIGYIVLAVNILARFFYLLSAWMTPHTPNWIILGVMCLTTIYIVKENIQTIARFSIIASIVFTGFIVTSLFVLKDATFSYLFPVGAQGIKPIIDGIPESSFSYFGYELFVIFYPFVQATHKEITRAATIANVYVTLFYFLLMVVTMISFTAKEMLMIPEPVLFLIKAISFRIIERPDLFFTSMWIVLVATTVFITIYTSSLGLATVINTTNIKYFAIVITVICFISALPFDDMFKMDKLTKFIELYIRPFFWGSPILFLIIAMLFKKKETVKDA